MTSDDLRADIAFMKSLVQPGEDFRSVFGRGYFIAGLCYTIQMLLHGAQLAGWSWANSPLGGLLIGVGPTVVFLVLLLAVSRRGGAPPTLANRALAAVFSAAGLANAILAVIIGLTAWRQQNFEIWLTFPCAVMVLQGAAWMVAWQVYRRGWFLGVSIGWFATGLAMGFAIGQMAVYIAVLGLGMTAFMLIPGFFLMRRPKAG